MWNETPEAGEGGVAMDRRHVLATAAAIGATAAMPAFAQRAAPAKFRNALCVSQFVDRILDRGVVFFDGQRRASNVEELQRLFMDYGSSEIFARLGTRRNFLFDTGDGQEPGVIQRAKLAKTLGLPLNPELLLCGTYGDMALQPEPDFTGYPEIKLRAAWTELTIDEMADAMRIYGEIAARRILDTGVSVNVWDIGNEVDFGIAGVAMPPMAGGRQQGWTYKAPDKVDPEIGKMTLSKFYLMDDAARVAWGKAHLWPHTGKIMAAVAEGIRKVDPRARFATHTSVIGMMPETFVGFYEAMDAAGFRTDELGVSYYPTNNGVMQKRLEIFQRTCTLSMEKLRRPLFLAEYSYAAGKVIYGGANWANPVENYPCNNDGQARFLRDLTEWGVRTGTISGIRPWAPDYVGAGWENMALFQQVGANLAVARPGLGSIQRGLMAGRSARRA